ncbi:hypothetical protein [Staphylococcus haemolyticus]|uniref:hypothetical protein n=1 Tax=Staphylococcus haemolyticus TaxID=1283 RepID=UPI0012EDAB34|nr:hypothetical protein [Staphylococcus haemolyticus]
MSIKDKATIIAGMMFNVAFFLSMMLNIFITNALAIGMVASTVTYIFFDCFYYETEE